ncbi:MAG: transcriptional repressor LexA [Alphaproteobacteria bacterium CG_4_10_14_0_2_um_filter_63_37]|nr:MAG: repressor LexA [Proteobacteria bacterium CG1_02_64_396]PJA25946.1 MAG: transcriptional repressor LexA [Alphaproteobacteria bacterium CG_4_10_14_0_2_um_filter_63_37]
MPIPAPRQIKLLDFLRRQQSETGQAPSYREIAEAMGWASTNAVSKALKELENEGLIRRLPGRNRAIQVMGGEHAGQVRLVGSIAAGRPIEAIENPDWIEIPPFMMGRSDTYALTVRGDSMCEDGILDGDIVLVESRSVAENGEIVVALIDREEATLKRFYIKGGQVTLIPANSTMAPMHYPADRVTIQGVVIGQMRSYLGPQPYISAGRYGR